MKQLPAIYRLAFAGGFIWLAFYYGRREIATENAPGETTPSNCPPAAPEISKPASEPPPTAALNPVESAASCSETQSPVQASEPRPVPVPPPPIRVVQVLARDRMVIECAANGSFLARGGIKRTPDGRWVQDGLWTNYWPKGTVSSVGEWKEGSQVGPWLFASEDGCSTVTNHPPFASAVAVAQQAVPPAATTTQDSVAVAKADDGQEGKPVETRANQNVNEDSGPSSPSVAVPVAKQTDPDLFVCGKHTDTFLKEADERFMRGEFKRAKNAFADYADQHLNAPERAYAMLQKAVCEERMGKLPEARAAYQDYLRVFGREECGAKGQAGLAALLWKQPSSRTQAIAEYEKLIKSYPAAPETAAALKLLGDHYLGQREYAKAQNCYDQFLANFPEAPGRPEVEAQAEAARLAGDSKGKTGGAAGVGFDEAAKPAQDLMVRGRYKEAYLLYRELSSRFGASPTSVSHCLMRMGLCRLNVGQFDAAVQHFQKLINNYPNAAETPEACWRCAQLAYCILGKPEDVKRMAQRLVRDHPSSFQAQQANYVLGLLMEEKGAKPQQYDHWTTYLKRWPESLFAKAIQQRLVALGNPPANRINLGSGS